MYIVMHKLNIMSLFSICIFLITLKKYTHASILIDDIYYDSVFSKVRIAGDNEIAFYNDSCKVDIFKIKNINFNERKKIIHNISKIIKHTEKIEGRLSDYFRNGENIDYYCFKFVAKCLNDFGFNFNIKKKISSKTIITSLIENKCEKVFSGYPIDFSC